METYAHQSPAGSLGARLGRLWRSFGRSGAWLSRHGVPQSLATALVWTLKLAAIVLALYIAFWIAVLVVLALLISMLARGRSSEPAMPVYEFTDPEDHRQHLFYHPITYNDDPDPRFSDPRFDRT